MICPYAKYFARHPYIICGLKIPENTDCGNIQNAATAMCLYQKFCRDVGKYINTNEYTNNCKRYLKETANS